MTLKINIAAADEKHPRLEKFWQDEIHVVSRSGLSSVERDLLRFWEQLSGVSPRAILVAGNRTGVTAAVARARLPQATVVAHAFDLHHAKAILRNLQANDFTPSFLHDPGLKLHGAEPAAGAPSLIVACTVQVPTASNLPLSALRSPLSALHLPPSYDLALFTYTPGLMTAELLLDQLEDIRANLTPGGHLLLVAETPQDALFKQIKTIFGSYTLLQPGDKKHPVALWTTARGEVPPRRTFAAKFSASVPGHEAIELISLPGVFCHRRPDAGGLALAETVVAEIEKEQPHTPPSLLDMGCGCGLVGLLVASAVPCGRVAFVDSHARALAATRQNAEALGLLDHCEFVLSDDGAPQRGFDLFAGNPPYYSEYRIADIFLETAKLSLHKGGRCYTVAKTATALERRQREVLGSVTELKRRGYSVLVSAR